MATYYTISGTLTDAARVVIIEEAAWTIESNTNESAGLFDVDFGTSDPGQLFVIARKADGESLVFGNVTPHSYQPPSSDRGIFAGGTAGGSGGTIDYISIPTTADAESFGNLAVGGRYRTAGCSSGSDNRGLIGGSVGATVQIDYMTISSTGDALDFGDMSPVRACPGSCSNLTNNRGIFGGGSKSGPSYTADIEYVTISSLGNSAFFGSLTQARCYVASTSNGTNNRGIFSGGQTGWLGTVHNIIDYVTISSTGNAANFGDLSTIITWATSCSNSINDRGIIAGGYGKIGEPNDWAHINVIQYVTISSLGNATNFGDLTVGRSTGTATSSGQGNRGIMTSGGSMDYMNISSLGDASVFGNLTVSRGDTPAACSNSD